ncbi:NAD(P)-dependent alcohol dehydrogenase [Citricoccus nitrophenolicus]
MSTMRAVRLTHWGQSPVVVDVPVPVPGAGEVLVAVEAAGLCQSDLHLMDGRAGDFPFDLPFTLGHEIAGRVAELGAGVDESWRGRSVAVYAIHSCGTCRSCRAGRENYCRALTGAIGPGIGHDGGLAEYVLVRDLRQLVPADGIDAVSLAPLTDAGLTAYHAIRTNLEAVGGGAEVGAVLVIGVGGLGHLAVQILQATTSARVVAVDPRAEARDSALAHGADRAHAALDDAVAEHPREGFDLVLDFVGIPDTAETALTALAPGGTLVLVGSGGAEAAVGKNRGLNRGWSVSAPFWGPRVDLERVIDLAARGRLGAETEVWDLERVPEAYDRLRQGRIRGRAVVQPDMHRARDSAARGATHQGAPL